MLTFRTLTLTLVSCLLIPSATSAEESDDFGGFDTEMEFEVPTESDTDERSSRFRFTASSNNSYLPEQSSDNSGFRTDVRMQWERLFTDKRYVVIDVKHLQRYPISEDDSEIRVRELFLQTGEESYSIRAGYQVVVWGEMDMLSSTDVMTPWDYSEFAFTAPEDARRGQPIISMEFYDCKGTCNIIFNLQPETNRYPGGGASTLLDMVLETETFTLDDQEPELFGGEYETGFRWSRKGDNGDISVMVASLLADEPLFELVNAEPQLEFNATYPRYEMIALTANHPTDGYLWKIETAYKRGLKFYENGLVERDSVDLTLGVDMIKGGIYNIGFEAHRQQLINGSGELTLIKPERTEAAIRLSRTFWNETLSAVYFISYAIEEESMVQSASLNYSVSDNASIELNGTIFSVGDENSPNAFIDQYDILSLRANYHF